MANFNSVVLTDKGIALMTKAGAGKCQIEFTKVQSGDGTWGSGESLSAATALKSVKQEAGVSRAAVVNGSTVSILGVFSNKDLTAGYYFREYGIFACEKGAEKSTEVLYAIITAKDNAADYMPPFNSISPQTMEMELYIAVANASEVTIKLGTGALASAEDLVNLTAKVEYLENLINQIITTGRATVPLVTGNGDELVTGKGETLTATKQIGG